MYALKNFVEVGVDLFIGYAQNAVATGDENGVTLGVGLALLIMNWAVHFDDEASGGAVEINDEAENDMLASKVQVTYAMLAKMLPEDNLFRCHALT